MCYVRNNVDMIAKIVLPDTNNFYHKDSAFIRIVQIRCCVLPTTNIQHYGLQLSEAQKMPSRGLNRKYRELSLRLSGGQTSVLGSTLLRPAIQCLFLISVDVFLLH